jgi:hypothetical protein
MIYSERFRYLLSPVERYKLLDLDRGVDIGLLGTAQIRIFMPDDIWSWYVTAFDGDDILFGLIAGSTIELSCFSLQDLNAIRGPLELQVEPDLFFQPKRLQSIKEALETTLYGSKRGKYRFWSSLDHIKKA